MKQIHSLSTLIRLEWTDFRLDSLTTGQQFDIVREEVIKALNDHLIVTHTGAADFSCLDLSPGDYADDWFDLNLFFKRKNKQPFALKTLYDKFFPGTNFQVGVHDAGSDATATMHFFMKYMEICKEQGILTRDHSLSYFDDELNFCRLDMYEEEEW